MSKRVDPRFTEFYKDRNKQLREFFKDQAHGNFLIRVYN